MGRPATGRRAVSKPTRDITVDIQTDELPPGPLRRSIERIEQIATLLSTAAFIVVVCAFGWTVFTRYVLGQPSRYGDEIAIIAFLWSVMIGAGLAARVNEHVSLDILVDVLPPKGARIADMLGALVAGAILLAMLPVTIDYVSFLHRETTSAMRLPLNWVFACFPVFQGAIAIRLLGRAWLNMRALKAPW